MRRNTERRPAPTEDERARAAVATTAHAGRSSASSPVPSAWSGPASSRSSVPPSLVARYDDIRFLGEGGMATVYYGMDPRLGRPVALKLMKGAEPELWRRFRDEARAQARIEHDHVCRVYETGDADGEPYIAMQFIDGEPLSSIHRRLTTEQCVQVLQQISAAVHHAHRLGVIHRDIKPGNILIEEQDDGSLKPYVVDFGLARQVEDPGHTQAGIAVGTPAYMSPEQAQGDAQAIDRRSDVYSLGATLYDVIAGRAPFVSDQPWKILMMIASEEVPPLGTVKKGISGDLETIVMKCLERDPAHRYESARALDEDLQRFLDGEPIHAKPASFGYVLWKKTRKHKGVAALVALLLIGSLGLVGVWVRQQRQAAERAQLAQELGEHLKEMELFLRAAYELPLHDVERERNIVRRRLEAIAKRMAASGSAAQGPGHYALGRGHLALGEPELSREHLEQALAAGYSSAELEYALGRALGELFRRELAETRRITNEEERKKKVAELDWTLRDPALRHLRAADSSSLEAPAYAEGLIALYEGKNAEAAAKASEAFEQAPWMYEAKKLEGDALFAEGSKYRHDAAFDHDRMKGYFEPAGQAYQLAADIGRSDPDVHRAECELWEKTGLAAANVGLPIGAPFDRAERACGRAVEASSKDGRALVQRALVLSGRLYVVSGDVTEETALAADEAVEAAEDSARARPDDVMAHYAVALALLSRTQVLSRLGREAAMDSRAIAAYQRVLEIDPSFTWAVNELGDAYLLEARREIGSGREGAPRVQDAIRQYEQAIALDPKFALPVGGRLEALELQVESGLDRGQDVAGALAALSGAVAQLEKPPSNPWQVAFWKARSHCFRGRHELALGRDPRPSVAAAVAVIGAFAGPAPADPWFSRELASCRLLEAEHARSLGLDPEAALAQAHEAVRKASESGAPMTQALRMLAVRLEIATLRAAGKRGKLRAESFNPGLALVRPLLSRPGFTAEPYPLAAEIHALRAEWLARSGRSPDEDLRSGLALVDSALARNPHLARAWLVSAQLHLVQARAAARGARAEAARRAGEAFEAAFRENPRFAREHAGAAKEASDLLR